MCTISLEGPLIGNPPPAEETGSVVRISADMSHRRLESARRMRVSFPDLRREDCECMCRMCVGTYSQRYVLEGGKDGELLVDTLRGERTLGAMEMLGAVGSWLENCEGVRRGYEGQS